MKTVTVEIPHVAEQLEAAMILVLTPDTAARFADEIDAGKPDPHPLARSVIEALSQMSEDDRRAYALHGARILMHRARSILAGGPGNDGLSDH